jgi:hypothetical protein
MWRLLYPMVFTCYGVYANTGIVLYQNVSSAYAAADASCFKYGTTANVTFNIQCDLSLIGTLATSSNIPNF